MDNNNGTGAAAGLVGRYVIRRRRVAVPGVGVLRLVREGSGPGVWAAADRPAIRKPEAAAAVLAPVVAPLVVEVFGVLVLDAQNRLACPPVEVTRGILNSSLVHPREVFRAAIVAGAASVILWHNHPSGETSPSFEDRKVTEQLVAAGRLLDIPIHDHVIIGDGGAFFSFASAGLL